MKEDLRPWTKERYDEVRARLEAKGYTVVTPWRPRLKHMRLADIVLTPKEEATP